MGTESDQPWLDGRLAELVRRQYGVVTREQLRRLGVGEHGIAARLRSGRLHRLYRGVYVVGHQALAHKAQWMAAVLACGPGAALSHAAAAAHRGIRPSSATLVDVTVPVRSGRRCRSGIRIHRCGRLAADEVTVHQRIPTTTVARTLLDLADVLDHRALKRAVDEAEYLRLLDVDAVAAAVAANPGRRGARLLAATHGPPELTRSALEERFLALVERHRLPRPLVGARVGDYQLDFLWPEAGLAVELDGYAAHGTRQRFESDRRRDRRLALVGVRTIRLTALALIYEEDAIAEELGAALKRSRASSNPPSRASISAARAR